MYLFNETEEIMCFLTRTSCYRISSSDQSKFTLVYETFKQGWIREHLQRLLLCARCCQMRLNLKNSRIASRIN